MLPPRSLVLVAAARAAIRSNDVEYPYRQNNDLLYLTGFPEPGSCLLLDNESGHASTLFVLPRDPERETWTGRRFGADGARETFGVDEAFTVDRFEEIFAERLAGRSHLLFDLGRDEPLDQKVLGMLQKSQATRPRTGAPALSLAPASDLIHEMRLRKDAVEIEIMKEAARITAVAHREAGEVARPDASEHLVEAALDYAFRRLGGAGPAYPSIVASGANATILHYVENDRIMRDGDLLLIDAGAEYGSYCADVTRTFPAGEKFTAEQRDVYEIVLAAQKTAIAMAGPGVTLEAIHDQALRVLVEGLRTLGALSSSVDEAIENAAFRPFYMHRTSHWLGMDVHDVGRYRVGDQPRKLEAGMVFTVEPGLYFAACDAAPRLEGIGVRIEDDVLVTDEGTVVLTAEIPKEPAEIEELRRAALARS